jgi:hypothetical protein
MISTANSAVVAVFRGAVITPSRHASRVALRLLARRLASRLNRFLDGLPEPHGDIDIQVLKRVSTPI